MVETFKEFLYRIGMDNDEFCPNCGNFVKDLGEWAWDNKGRIWIELYKPDWLERNVSDLIVGAEIVCEKGLKDGELADRIKELVGISANNFLIAVACLGETEVKKRLEAEVK